MTEFLLGIIGVLCILLVIAIIIIVVLASLLKSKNKKLKEQHCKKELERRKYQKRIYANKEEYDEKIKNATDTDDLFNILDDVLLNNGN